MTSRSNALSRSDPHAEVLDPPPPLSQNHNSIDQTRVEQPPPRSRPSSLAPNRMPAGTTSGPQSLTASRSPSAAASPWSSRDSSPAGRPQRQQPGSTAARGMRSRKNSHDASPSRSAQPLTSTAPSAAAIQRALSAATAPQLQPTPAADPLSKIPRSQRSTPGSDGPMQWPISPRLKSPPPSTDVRRSSLRRAENTSSAPNIVVQPSTPASSNEDSPAPVENLQKEVANRLVNTAKTSSRSINGAPKLETVQEASLPTASGLPLESSISSADLKSSAILSEDEPSLASPQKTPRAATKDAKGDNSSSDSGDRTRSPRPRDRSNDTDSTPRPKALSSKGSLSSLKLKSGVEAATRNMTVETETVNSVAQAALGPPDRTSSGRVGDAGGTLRTKSSNDFTKPKKDKKKTSRKAPSTNATSASTRADIFEGQVLDAMDQASSDSSDETFVYESNPPDPTPHRSRGRHHSRTPSATSMTSMQDQRGNIRSINSILDPQRQMQKSRSMKFTSAYSSGDNEEVDRQDGTIRATNTSRGNSNVHHHHLGRQNRNHTSIIDDNNPTFPQISRQRSFNGITGRQSHNAKLAAQNLRVSNNSVTKKKNGDGYTSYDMDDEPADDERTPLVGNNRNSRSGPRTPRTPRNRYQATYPRHRRSIASRFAGCIVLIVMLILLACGVVGFLFAISKPLTDVEILEIQHVLASEQELMFDLVVEATNPNLLPISITNMDVNLFAKSKYVGSEKWWRDHPNLPSSDHITKRRQGYQQTAPSNVDEDLSEADALGFFDHDPSDHSPNEGSSSKQTMLLGHVYQFDNPLTFDGSFWRHQSHYSTASLRLNKPGNHTELGGTERWERVLQHPFELIVRGVLKYQIPLGGSKHTASVSSSSLVHPERGVDDPDEEFRIKLSPPKFRFARFNSRPRSEEPHIHRSSFMERLMDIFFAP